MSNDDGKVIPFQRKEPKPLKFPTPDGDNEDYAPAPSMEEIYYQLSLKLKNPILLDAIKMLSFESPWFKFVPFRSSMLTQYEEPEYYEGKGVPDYIYKVVMYLDPLLSVGGPVLEIKFYGRDAPKAKDKLFPYFPTGKWKDSVPGATRLYELVLRDIKAYYDDIRERERVQVEQSPDARKTTFTFIDLEDTRVVFEICDEEEDDE